MKSTEYGYILSNGKSFEASNGILGLTPGVGKRVLFEGYDGDAGDASDYTPSERREIARFMIDLWEAWADDL